MRKTNHIALIPALLIAFAAAGCSSRNVYDAIRFHQEIGCSELQGADREECYRRSGMSYDEYERRLKEQQEGKKPEDRTAQ